MRAVGAILAFFGFLVAVVSGIVGCAQIAASTGESWDMSTGQAAIGVTVYSALVGAFGVFLVWISCDERWERFKNNVWIGTWIVFLVMVVAYVAAGGFGFWWTFLCACILGAVNGTWLGIRDRRGM